MVTLDRKLELTKLYLIGNLDSLVGGFTRAEQDWIIQTFLVGAIEAKIVMKNLKLQLRTERINKVLR
jgi:hypothetical protein